MNAISVTSKNNNDTFLNAFRKSLVKMIVRLWDDITDTPVQFSFTSETDDGALDRSQFDLVMYFYNPQGYKLRRVGVKMDRGADKLKRYHTRAIRRLLNQATQCGFVGLRYIERPSTSECIWSHQKL